jgi:hypothetical protein
MAINTFSEGTEGVAKGSYYKGTNGNWFILESRTNGQRWAEYTYEPQGTLLTGSKIPTDAPSSPNSSSAPGGSSASRTLTGANSGPLGAAPSSSTVRYPHDMSVGNDSDYVLFEFGKYIPPFSQTSAQNGGATMYADYNGSSALTPVAIPTGGKDSDDNPITASAFVLPMPQDLSNEMKQNWSGKAFSGIGRSAIAALAGGDFSKLGKTAGNWAGNFHAAREAITKSALNSVPGVGGNLSVSDISGSTRGVVLNPNVEVLYDSPDLREIAMVFKMVPRSSSDSTTINAIVRAFRYASLPQWGGEGGDLTIKGEGSNATFSQENFIRVPLLCKFTFMRGGSTNPNVIQFKPCAITRVQVNYTPDGTYATYSDGNPVATELSIGFLESKLIFRDEVSQGF